MAFESAEVVHVPGLAPSFEAECAMYEVEKKQVSAVLMPCVLFCF